MASQVLSGTNTSLTYTNSTGQNVRVIINYLRYSGSATMTAGSMSVTTTSSGTVGRNLAYTSSSPNGSNNAVISIADALPTEVMLAPGQVFSVSGTTTYNIIIIPEAG